MSGDIILNNVYVVGIVGITHVQCMCVSCHYNAVYQGFTQKICAENVTDNIDDVMCKRDQYYCSWSDNCMPVQMLLVASKSQWEQIPDIRHTGHIANVLASTHLEGVNILCGCNPINVDDIITSKGRIEENIGNYQVGWLWRNMSIPDTTNIPKITFRLTSLREALGNIYLEKCDVKISFTGNRANVMFRYCVRKTVEEMLCNIEKGGDSDDEPSDEPSDELDKEPDEGEDTKYECTPI